MKSQLYYGDCLDILSAFPVETFHCAIVDPPYFGATPNYCRHWKTLPAYEEWLVARLQQVVRTLRFDGTAFLFGRPVCLTELYPAIKSCGLHLWQEIVIARTGNTTYLRHTNNHSVLPTQHESCWLLRRLPYQPANVKHFAFQIPVENGSPLTSVWEAQHLRPNKRRHQFIHGIKTRRTIRRLLRSCTQPGDVINDPFCGSGTVPIVAESMDRSWVSIENDADHYNYARRNIYDTLYRASVSTGERVYVK